MKVTVCFGPVKIIVPCGDGALTVQDLIEKSIQRYRKALGKDDLYWVKVHSLQSQSDGGILDGDDLVSDVADDREKLTALFEEEEAGSVKEQLISDGTSSIGTTSPINVNEMNHINNSNNKTLINGNYPQENGELDIVVTGNEAVSRLQVRQNGSPYTNNFTQPRSTTSKHRLDSNANSLPHKNANRYDSDENQDAFDRFSRDSSRRSLSSAHPSVFKWAEAQQRIEDMATQNSPTSPPPNPLAVSPMAREQVEIEMVNDGTPLGIHIIARVENEDGSGYGLVVHGIENGGRAAKDKRLQPGDHILAINSKNITQETFDHAQEMMRTAMRTPTVKLLIERDKPGRPLSPSKVPPVVPQRSPQTTLTHPDKNKKPTLVGTSTKRISRKLYIQLMKGPQSLGFSITTRDNPIDGKIPIYIKNILPNGAAIADGRLKPGDRLIEVNGIEMSGKTQEEAVSILRSVRRGGVVNLVVSRQEQMEADPVFPRALPADLSPDDHNSPNNNKTVLDFNIALNDTGSAGLGVSVKGKTTGGANGETKDLGIFIKSVMHGGAASKDGRLRPNDQLLCINEVSLINMSNSEAMDTLRKAMSSEKSPRSTIRLVIARRQDMVETLHNALNKAEMGVEASVDRPIDVSRVVLEPQREKQLETDQEAEDVLKQPLMSDQGSLLQNISETLSAKHNVELTPKLDPQPMERSEGRARVTYPGSTVNIHPAGGMTLPSSGEDKALIENGGLHLQVGVNSPNSTTSRSPQSPRAPAPPEWLANWEDGEGDGELSPVLISRDQFQRDSYARLSFSERKQGGSLDAKQMAWYKKSKGASNKELESPPPKQKDVAASTGSLTRAASMDSLLDKQPITVKMDQTEAMKKSNSMDRLSERDRRSSTEHRPQRRRLSRKNGLNESFRAAVDKSLPQDKDASSEADKSDVPPPMTRERKRSTKEKKKKEKEATTGTNSKGIKGFFRFGKSRKSISEDKDSDASKDEESKISRQEAEKTKAKEEAQDEQERIQEALRRQREESQEARTKAERMLELRQKYQQNHRSPYPEDVSDEEGNWQNDDRTPQRDQGQEDKDWRYERLSDGRSHPEREYRDSKGRIIDDYYRGRDGNYRADERDRRYKDDRYRTESTDERDRRYNNDRYRPERRHSESYEYEHDSEGKIGPSRDDRLEKRSKKDGKRESPTEEKEKDSKNTVMRRDSGSKGSKKDKKKQKEGKERSDSERDDGISRKTEQLYDTPQSPAKYAPSEGTRTSRTREPGREEQRKYSQDRPDGKGYGGRNRSHERPRDKGDHHRDRRPEDWQRDRRSEDWSRDRREDDRRDSRPYGGTERGPRRYPQDQRDFGSLDRHSQREFRSDHQRRPRDEYYHQDAHSTRDYPPSQRYPTSGDTRYRHNGDPRYPQGYGHGHASSSRPAHQRSKSYDMDQINGRQYDNPGGYGDVQFTPRTGYSRGYDGAYRQQEDTARV